MRRQTYISSNFYIIVFVQGLIGNIDTNLSTHLTDWSINNTFDFWSWNFKGHELTDTTLGTISEQLFHLRQELAILTSLYPEKSIICIGHSQGAYLLLRMFYEDQIVYPTILLNPALNLTQIILTERLNEEDHTALQNGTSVFKEFSPKKRKWLTPTWYNEYANLDVNFQINTDSTYAIWGTEDTIISNKDKKLSSLICNPYHISISGDHAFSKTLPFLSETLSDITSDIQT